MLHDINHKVRLAEVIVAREKDFGVNDQQYSCITHLGNILREGDVVFGYDFTNTNWNVDEEDNEDNVLDKHSSFPDLVLVRKVGGTYVLFTYHHHHLYRLFFFSLSQSFIISIFIIFLITSCRFIIYPSSLSVYSLSMLSAMTRQKAVTGRFVS